MVVNKNGQGTARSTSWATPSSYEKQNDGEPGQTAVIDLMPCREASEVWYVILGFNVPLDTVQVISETGGPEQ